MILKNLKTPRYNTSNDISIPKIPNKKRMIIKPSATLTRSPRRFAPRDDGGARDRHVLSRVARTPRDDGGGTRSPRRFAPRDDGGAGGESVYRKNTRQKRMIIKPSATLTRSPRRFAPRDDGGARDRRVVSRVARTSRDDIGRLCVCFCVVYDLLFLFK